MLQRARGSSASAGRAGGSFTTRALASTGRFRRGNKSRLDHDMKPQVANSVTTTTLQLIPSS